MTSVTCSKSSVLIWEEAYLHLITFRWVVAGKILLQRPEFFSHSRVVGEELYVSCMFWSALRQKEGNRAWKHWKVEWDVYRAISEARCGWKDRLNHWKEALTDLDLYLHSNPRSLNTFITLLSISGTFCSHLKRNKDLAHQVKLKKFSCRTVYC